MLCRGESCEGRGSHALVWTPGQLGKGGEDRREGGRGQGAHMATTTAWEKLGQAWLPAAIAGLWRCM